MHFTEAQVALAGLIVQFMVGVFGSGVFYATVRFLRKEVKEVKDEVKDIRETQSVHGEVLAGLKAHTHYAGR